MDLNSLIVIVVAIVVVYFFVRLIVSPLIKAVAGIIIFIVAIYLLQRFFGFNLNNILGPLGLNLNLGKWNLNLGWILGPANYYIDLIKKFVSYIWGNYHKNLNQ